MSTGDKILGAGFLLLLIAGSGLDGQDWKKCLAMVVISLFIMAIGGAIKESAGRQP